MTISLFDGPLAALVTVPAAVFLFGLACGLWYATVKAPDWVTSSVNGVFAVAMTVPSLPVVLWAMVRVFNAFPR